MGFQFILTGPEGRAKGGREGRQEEVLLFLKPTGVYPLRLTGSGLDHGSGRPRRCPGTVRHLPPAQTEPWNLSGPRFLECFPHQGSCPSLLPGDFYFTNVALKAREGLWLATVTQHGCGTPELRISVSKRSAPSLCLLLLSYPLNPRTEEKLGSGPWRHCCSPAGPVVASARIFWRHDRSPGDTVWSCSSLEDGGCATQGFPSVLSKAHTSLSEPPGWEPRLGLLIQANSLLILIGGFA